MYDMPRMVDKHARQEAVRKLVAAGAVRTQGEMLALLRKSGVNVDQSTLSRDLTELGIRKRGGRYEVPAEVTQPRPRQLNLAAAVRRFFTCGPHMIVVSTGVGQAQPVALAIESEKDESIAATLAGDDTIFVVTRNRRSQAVALRRLEQWFGEKHER